MKVIHIGLPKTATTTLQCYTFPQLQRFRLISQYNPASILSALKRINRGYFNEKDVLEIREKVDSLDSALISLEGLVGTDPQTWLKQSERNLRMFGADSLVLITLREPKEYLRSVYQQVVHQGHVVHPNYFFLNDLEYSRCGFLPEVGNILAFNVDEFSYEKLISMYQVRFATVVVVAMEALKEMDYLEAIFKISADQKKILKHHFLTSKPQNESYSKFSMTLTFIREQIFRGLGAKTMGSEDQKLELFLDEDRAVAAGKNFISRIFRHMYKRLTWRKLMQKVVNKWGPKARWELPCDLYLGCHMERNSMYYSALMRDGGVRVFTGCSHVQASNPFLRPVETHAT